MSAIADGREIFLGQEGMLETMKPALDRRGFLRLAAAAGVAPLSSAGAMAVESERPVDVGRAAAAPAVEPKPDSYLSCGSGEERAYLAFGPEEAAFVEAAVKVMCPADDLTPNGVDCGLAIFIDRQLAGGFGNGERLYMRGPWRKGKPQHGYQLPLTPQQFFKLGIARVAAVCRERFGKSFDELATADQDRILTEFASGKGVGDDDVLTQWFHELLYPLFIAACFADPIYGGNRSKVFWKMVGYPGLPATHSQNMVEFRGKHFPGAEDPKSIADFS